jgi:hypothetical protein
LDDKYNLLSAKLKQEFLQVKSFAAITTDIWTDVMNTKSFLGITVHYLQQEILKSITIGVHPLEHSHTSDYIGSTLVTTCEDWNIVKEKVMVVVTDNAANMVKAVQENYGRTKHLPCLAHSMNLVVSNSIKTLPDLKEIVMKVKSIVTFFKQSVSAYDQLRKLQVQNGKTEGTLLKLVQECETRWNTTYYMLKRFIELANFIGMVLFNFAKPPMVTHEELVIIKELLTILRPFENITVEMSGEGYVTCSKVIPIIHCLKLTLDKINPSTEIGKKLLQKLKDDTNKRFYSDTSNVEKNGILAVATIVDPRFKRIHFESPRAIASAVSKISELIRKEIEDKNNLRIDPEPESRAEVVDQGQRNIEDEINLWEIHDTLTRPTEADQISNERNSGMPHELKHYLDQPVISRLSFTDPIKYWNSVKIMYPNLHTVALRYLPVVSTSVPSERLFSKAGNILTEKRNRLTGKRLSSLIFLSSLNHDQYFSGPLL